MVAPKMSGVAQGGPAPSFQRTTGGPCTFKGRATVVGPPGGPTPARPVPVLLMVMTGVGFVVQLAVFLHERTHLLLQFSGVGIALVTLLSQVWSRGFLWRPRPRLREGELRLDGPGVTLGSQRLFRVSSIASAYAPDPAEPVVRIVLHPVGSVDLRLESGDRVQELIHALGFRAGQSTAIFPVVTSWVPSLLSAGALCTGPWLAFAMMVHIVAFTRGAEALVVWAMSGIVAMAGALWLCAFREMHVGGDGLLLRSLVGGRFVGYGRLAAVAARGEAVTLTVGSGTTLRFRAKEAAAIVAKIEAARLAFDGTGAPRGTARNLARGVGDGIDWANDLRTLLDSGPYRTALSPAVLWRIVEDPVEPPSNRAGAALALASKADEEGRARIRLAGRSCANPRLRVALEQLAESGDEERVARGISHLSPRRDRSSTSVDVDSNRRRMP